jgi:hypothetical protein
VIDFAATAVHIERSTCAATPLPEIVAVLRVELSKQLVEGPIAPDEGAYRVAIDCGGDRVTIVVAIPKRGPKSYEKNLAGAPPNVRSRIVALAIAEIVRDLDREPPPAPPPPPVVVTPPPPPVIPDRPSPPPARHVVRIGAFGQASSFHVDGVWLVGGGLRFDYAFKRIGVGLDAVIGSSNEHYDLGSAQVIVAYGSPTVAWREELGALETRLGAGYAIGAARITGHAETARAIDGRVTGAWGAPYAFAGASIMLGALAIDFRAQAGWVIFPVVGEITRDDNIELRGLWASGQLGLSLAL